jgi:hypothetical protein
MIRAEKNKNRRCERVQSRTCANYAEPRGGSPKGKQRTSYLPTGIGWVLKIGVAVAGFAFLRLSASANRYRLLSLPFHTFRNTRHFFDTTILIHDSTTAQIFISVFSTFRLCTDFKKQFGNSVSDGKGKPSF